MVILAQSYQPYGEILANAGTITTNYGFTAEWRDPTDLIHLRARYYAPELGWFLSRDAWKMDYTKPFSLNQRNYGYNNPIKYTDPSGHTSVSLLADFVTGRDYSGIWKTDGSSNIDKNGNTIEIYQAPDWTLEEQVMIHLALSDVAASYSRAYNLVIMQMNMFRDCLPWEFIFKIRSIDPITAFLKVHGGKITFERTAENATQYFKERSSSGISNVWAYTLSPRKILIFRNAQVDIIVNHPRWIVHEVGHAFENSLLESPMVGSKAGRNNLPINLLVRYTEKDAFGGFYGPFNRWQYSKDSSRGEIIADMFIGWVYDLWGKNALGNQRDNYMTKNMPRWIFKIIAGRN